MNGIGPIGGGGIQQILAMRQQILDRSQILKDVHQATQGGAPAAQAPPPGGGFGGALSNALQDVSATQGRAEDLSAAYERGDVTDIAKVMLARQEAGVAFEATLQVRNRLLSAYQDIMRMGV
ncbi:flagellar hook-basal body complex protein FliE [Novosphingobium sp.]|uniref:flagellar hook-basal body complex protein FliE n=1 Tax=Novosphingobium sp. TaxID=1874826 RepID=UPI002869F4F7|nr:flagellar hook-basal body complex protein FliE [Novosphingobium sp.]